MQSRYDRFGTGQGMSCWFEGIKRCHKLNRARRTVSVRHLYYTVTPLQCIAAGGRRNSYVVWAIRPRNARSLPTNTTATFELSEGAISKELKLIVGQYMGPPSTRRTALHALLNIIIPLDLGGDVGTQFVHDALPRRPLPQG